jgi:L-ascorbate metabolism protein UlaG (beta-lactamase superfamily)
MIINYLGLSAFRLQINGTSILLDPPAEASGLKLSRMQNDIVIYSQAGIGDKKDKSFVIDLAGEYEVKEIFIYGLETEDGRLIYLIETENMRLVHLGGLSQVKLTPEQLERLEGADVLFVPVGGGDSLTAKQAAELVNQLEPRLVIPMNYKIPGVKLKLDSLDDFKKEMGGKFETTDKLKLARKDLPEEETNFIIINPA